MFSLINISTCEFAHYKGNSDSSLLTFLSYLNACQMSLHFVHVSGTRMMKQATDRLLRRELRSAVIEGRAMFEPFPLCKSGFGDMFSFVTAGK